MKKNKMAMIFLFAVLALSLCVPMQAQAKASRKKAVKAYTKFLKKNMSKFKVVEGDTATKNSENYKKCSSFMVLDMNKDGIPELITSHDVTYGESKLYIYTYKKGKVKLLKDKQGNYAKVQMNSGSTGSYKVFACNNNHLHVNWTGRALGYSKTVYSMKKGKIKEYLYISVSSRTNNKVCRLNGKTVKAKKVKAKLKNCKQEEDGGLHVNTKSKRKEYVH